MDWDRWRGAARRVCLEGVAPGEVRWAVGAPDDLFAQAGEYAAFVEDLKAIVALAASFRRVQVRP
ncbi:MAG: hypothetical protein ACRYF2_22435 [Janthinobacterium lividum]